MSVVIDKTIRIWEMETKKNSTNFEMLSEDGTVISIPNREKIVAVDPDEGLISIWDISLDSLRGMTRRLFPPLSPEERRQYNLE